MKTNKTIGIILLIISVLGLLGWMIHIPIIGSLRYISDIMILIIGVYLVIKG